MSCGNVVSAEEVSWWPCDYPTTLACLCSSSWNAFLIDRFDVIMGTGNGILPVH